VGSGKSYAGCLKGIEKALLKPKSQGLIGRKEFASLEKTTMRVFFNEVMPLYTNQQSGFKIVSYNQTKHILVLNNGSVIFFSDLNDAEKIKSFNLNWWFVDEATEITEQMFNMLTTRLREGEGNQGFMATNPSNYYHWIYKRIIKPYINGNKDKFDVIQTNTTENYALSKEYLDDMNEFMKIDEDYYKQYIMGQWGVMGEGIVYKTFDPLKHVQEFDYKNIQFKSLFRSIDWGFENPFVCLYIGIDNEDNVFVFDEYYIKETSNEDNANNLLSKYSDMSFQNTFVDPSASHFIALLISKKQRVTLANNAVEEGIMSVRRKLAIKKSFDGTEKPSLLIHPNCKNLITEFQNYIYAKWKTGDMKEIPKEEPVKKNDHCLDALRYFIHTYYMINRRSNMINIKAY
jgi:PBSX family phage terminase large subunit